MPEPFEINVYLQNNDHVRMLEALLEDARKQEAVWRNRCTVAEMCVTLTLNMSIWSL